MVYHCGASAKQEHRGEVLNQAGVRLANFMQSMLLQSRKTHGEAPNPSSKRFTVLLVALVLRRNPTEPADVVSSSPRPLTAQRNARQGPARLRSVASLGVVLTSARRSRTAMLAIFAIYLPHADEMTMTKTIRVAFFWLPE